MAAYSNFSDQELTVLLKERDHAAFTEIYERYWALLFRHARRMIYNDEEAGDIVQEVFSYLWDKSGSIYLQHSLSAYLYSAIRHKTLDLIKRSRVKDKYLFSLGKFSERSNIDLNEDLILKELERKIEAGIQLLPPKMRAVFELSRKKNLSHRDIAQELNISDSAVKKQITRALKILRQHLHLILIIWLLFFIKFHFYCPT